MDWLTALFTSLGTWPGVFVALIVCAFAFGSIYILVKYFKGFKRLAVGNVSLEKDGSVKIRKASLEKEEVQRIALEQAVIIIDYLQKNYLHDCVQAQNIEQLMAGQRPVLEMVTALAADASARGVNGRVAAAQDGLEDYRVAHAKWADAKLAGVG